MTAPHPWPVPVTAGRVLSEDELAALFADSAYVEWLSRRHKPLPAVLDTDFVRTGLHYQMTNGLSCASISVLRRLISRRDDA